MKETDKLNTYVDLHVHSNASDGTYTPKQIVKYAAKKGLTAVALTDHDTISGIKEGLRAARRAGIELIPGVEFSTEIGSESFHIVGLYIDHKKKALIDLTKEIGNSRELRSKKIIAKINDMNAGPKIVFEEVNALADGVIGRPHIASILIEKGYAKSIEEVFAKYLNRGAPGYVPRFKLTPKEAVHILKKNGATPILAHPCYVSDKFDLKEFLIEHQKEGLEGIEVYYPSHSPRQTKFFRNLAEELGLLMSGGSDCHGELNGGPYIGNIRVRYELLQKIKEYRKK
ncbi:MAG: PHP domain-containing protein [Candidatus Heimdallarchaeota archaeon]